LDLYVQHPVYEYILVPQIDTMTWILYFYDAEDVEIGWVKADPYEFEVTHPDGPDVYSGVRYRLRKLENPTKVGGFSEVIGRWTMASQQLVHLDLSGKEHLDYIETEISSIDGIGSTALVDE
jgi:hypothetical protein